MESSRLSLNSAESSMNAAFGDVSAGGVGTPLLDVPQSGGGPSALIASQPWGNAGGVTLSKFSLRVSRRKHGPHLPLLRARRGLTATVSAINKTNRRRLGDRVRVKVHFGLSTITAAVMRTLHVSTTKRRALSTVFDHSRRPTIVKSVCAFPR